jgi:hypothetical protein
MKYHRLILLCSITNIVLCAERYKYPSKQKSVGEFDHLKNVATQCNLNELDKFNFIMTLFENDSFATLIEYKRNVRNMFKIIENNRYKESKNDKLTKIIKELKIKLCKVTNEYNQKNYLHFLDSSIRLINSFIDTFCDKDNNSVAMVLNRALENIVFLLENVDKLMTIIEDFLTVKELNLKECKSSNIKKELQLLKKPVDKLTKEFKTYMDFRQVNYNYFNTVMIYRIIKLQTYFKNTSEDISTMSEDNFKTLTVFLKDDLLTTISEFYEKLNDYYEKDFLLLFNVLTALDNVWAFAMNFIKSMKSYKD